MMLFTGGLVSLAVVAVTAYLALFPGTSRPVRRAAFIALIIISLAVLTCSLVLLFFLVFSPAAKGMGGGEALLPARDKADDGLFPVIAFLLAMLVTLAVIIALSIREQRRKRHSKRP
jgi:glucan phosphoethanolaminetransferase (alkaline phosphatase superfamily)